MDKESIRKYVLDNPSLVSMKESTSHPGLYVLKYKKRVFFDNLWNEYLEECRGTVVDADFNIVSFPFRKIYNYGIDKQSPKFADDVLVDAYRKINGFMVSVTFNADDILVSTTGTTDSDYVKMARELIDTERYRKVCKAWYGTTFIFECVHRNDPHIVPEKEGMYLLGYRVKNWTDKVRINPKVLHDLTEEFGTVPVEHYRVTVGELLNMVKTVKHEGFVAYTDLGEAFKIKSPHYLVNKWLARNPRTDKLMRDDIFKQVDEEYYPLVGHIREHIDVYTAMSEQERLEFVRKFLG